MQTSRKLKCRFKALVVSKKGDTRTVRRPGTYLATKNHGFSPQR